MEETSAQKPLSKEEILAEFANTTFDARFADFFYDRYLDEFEVWEDYDNPNEMALKCVKHGLMWYALYKQIGHHKLWCEEAYSFGCECVEIEISLENEVICMFTIEDNLSCYSPDIYRVTKKAEYVKHLSHIKEAYNKDDVFIQNLFLGSLDSTTIFLTLFRSGHIVITMQLLKVKPATSRISMPRGEDVVLGKQLSSERDYKKKDGMKIIFGPISIAMPTVLRRMVRSASILIFPHIGRRR